MTTRKYYNCQRVYAPVNTTKKYYYLHKCAEELSQDSIDAQPLYQPSQKSEYFTKLIFPTLQNDQIMTATVETITEQLDMAVSLPPADAPPTATAHTHTLTDTDVATATADVSIAVYFFSHGYICIHSVRYSTASYLN